jgi:integrase
MVQLTTAGMGQSIELYAGHDQPIAALKDALLERKALKPKTEKSYRKAFARFEAVVGDKPISEITRNDVVRFVEDLEATRSDKRERAPLDPQTTQKYLSHIQTFFDEAKGKNRVRTNPAEGVAVTRKASRPEDERSPFTPSELQAIFDTPLYRGCKSAARIHAPGRTKCRDGRFWYGLVMMFTGARNGEIEALSVDDVVEHYGIWHLDIHKSTKTRAGRRLVPIHSDLIRMGFLDWVARRRCEAPGGKLFEPRKYGRIWNEGVLVTAGVKTDKTCTYSFRHTFEDGLKELVQDETKRRLMGHAEERMGGRYGNGQITQKQAEAIERLDLGGIDVSFLYEYASVADALSAFEG